jgi:hypothetical protein
VVLPGIFGSARTATAPVLIGLVFVVLEVGFGESGSAMLKTIPDAVLGGLFLFSGIEFALSSKVHEYENGNLFLVLRTAAIGVALNPAAAFAIGLPIDPRIQTRMGPGLSHLDGSRRDGT